jgi:drug/metabolite transporter (DMT)-like permease
MSLTKNEKIKKIIPPLMLVLAAMIWGFAFSAQKSAERVPAFTTGAVRSLFAFVFLIITVIAFDKINNTGRRLFSKEKIIDFNKTEIIGGAVCGVILALATFFQQNGMNMGADAGKASFITALYVVLVPIYALALRKKAPLNVWIGIAIAVVGFYFLCITGKFTILTCDLWVLICSLMFPIHILVIDTFSPRCDGVRMSCVQFFFCMLTNLLFALIFERGTPVAVVFDSFLPLLYLGICSSGIAYTLQIIAQKRVNPAAASILMSLESVFGVLGSAILLGETMSRREYLGCAIVFLAVIISQIDFKILKHKGKGD